MENTLGNLETQNGLEYGQCPFCSGQTKLKIDGFIIYGLDCKHSYHIERDDCPSCFKQKKISKLKQKYFKPDLELEKKNAEIERQKRYEKYQLEGKTPEEIEEIKESDRNFDEYVSQFKFDHSKKKVTAEHNGITFNVLSCSICGYECHKLENENRNPNLPCENDLIDTFRCPKCCDHGKLLVIGNQIKCGFCGYTSGYGNTNCPICRENEKRIRMSFKKDDESLYCKICGHKQELDKYLVNNGYCPSCEINNNKIELSINKMDYWECPECKLMCIAVGHRHSNGNDLPLLSILAQRGNGELKTIKGQGIKVIQKMYIGHAGFIADNLTSPWDGSLIKTESELIEYIKTI